MIMHPLRNLILIFYLLWCLIMMVNCQGDILSKRLRYLPQLCSTSNPSYIPSSTSKTSTSNPGYNSSSTGKASASSPGYTPATSTSSPGYTSYSTSKLALIAPVTLHRLALVVQYIP